MVLPWRPGTSGASQYDGRTKPSYPVGIYNILFFMKTWRKFLKKILVERKIKERERQKKHVTLIQYHIVINGFTPN